MVPSIWPSIVRFSSLTTRPSTRSARPIHAATRRSSVRTFRSLAIRNPPSSPDSYRAIEENPFPRHHGGGPTGSPDGTESEKIVHVIKVDLHIHTGDDPRDRIPYSTTQLIACAAAQGFGAVAITLHERQLSLDDVQPFAADRGVVLIPGIERTIEGK